MNMFLESIIMSGAGSDLSRKTGEFFSKKMDFEKVNKFLNIYRQYTRIVNLLNDRNKNCSTPMIDEIEKELSLKYADLSVVKKKLFENHENQIMLNKSLETTYNSSSVNFALIGGINEKLVELVNDSFVLQEDMKQLFLEIQEIASRKNDMEVYNLASDLRLEELIAELKNMLSELDGDYSLGVNLDSFMYEYEKSLLDIIKDGESREIYVEYLFDALKMELAMLESTADLASYYVTKADKNSDYLCDGIDLENDRITVFNDVETVVKNNITNFGNVWSKGSNNEELNKGYRIIKSLFDGIMDYILSPESKYDDDYEFLYGANLDIEDIKQKNRRKGIFGTRVTSNLSEIDIPLSFGNEIFNRFNNSNIVHARNHRSQRM